ncbi:MAG: hypothetical protein TREMPRED_005085 [Tremellales sp. Tagirdzhanova-0007]|nr:MAG: hypothetical protein TREMPRED_005085 [Tremellales sp. Tagirdzhanova-0007]
MPERLMIKMGSKATEGNLGHLSGVLARHFDMIGRDQSSVRLLGLPFGAMITVDPVNEPYSVRIDVCTVTDKPDQYSTKQTLSHLSKPDEIFSLLRSHFQTAGLPIYDNYRLLRTNDYGRENPGVYFTISPAESGSAQWGTSWEVIEEQAKAAPATRSLEILSNSVHQRIPWLGLAGDALEVRGVLGSDCSADNNGRPIRNTHLDPRFQTWIAVLPSSEGSSALRQSIFGLPPIKAYVEEGLNLGRDVVAVVKLAPIAEDCRSEATRFYVELGSSISAEGKR